MGRGDDRKIKGIEAEKPDKLSELQRERLEQIQRLQKEERELPKELERPDVFRKGSLIPQFLRSVQQRLESSRVYRSFKIPGTEYIVHDKRDEVREEGKARDAGHPPAHELELKEGKLERIRAKVYENFLGEKMPSETPKKGGEEAARLKRPLSPFEKMVLERFEKGREVAKESEDGKPHFLEKSESEWKAFFDKFLARTHLKKTEIENIKEFIFRGMLAAKGSAQKQMLVSDMILKNGKIEKFIRFNVLADKLGKLLKLPPGSALTAEMIARGLGGDVLKYLALVSKHKAREIQTAQEDAKGLFMSKRTEERVAKHLGISGGEEGASRDKVRRGKKKLGGLFEGEEGALEEGKFVPWWSWGREDRIGVKRWYVSLFLIVILVLLGVGILLASLFL